MSNIISPGSKVEKVLIWKDESEHGYQYNNMVLECHLYFDNGKEVVYELKSLWSSKQNKYITCPLEDVKYSRGIYEYKNDEYIQIENWD